MNNVDWSLIHSFLAVSRLGSLSRAAQTLGVSQPTLTRNIQALEAQTQVNLFRRSTQGLRLTEAGQALVDAAARMEDGALQFQRQIAGLSAEIDGDIRISAAEIIGFYWLPPAITALRERHPRIQIEIVITNDTSSLNKREADIALRMYQPTQPDLTAKRLRDVEIGFYAHRDYLAKHGTPATFDELLKCSVIGGDQDRSFIDGAAHFGYSLSEKNFDLRTDHQLLQINLIRSGAGIGVIHRELAKNWPELIPILPELPLPPLPFWAVCHHDVQYSPKIRAVMQFLGEWFAPDNTQPSVIV